MATPEQQAYQAEYYRRNKEKVLGRMRAKRTPEKKALERAKYKERYANDPEYRAKLAAHNKRWRERHPGRMSEVVAKHRKRKNAIVMEARANSSCKECGESHPACLDFHHRDPKTKKHRISLMGWRGLRVETMLAELAKCDVLCANCHRKLHWGHKWQASA